MSKAFWVIGIAAALLCPRPLLADDAAQKAPKAGANANGAGGTVTLKVQVSDGKGTKTTEKTYRVGDNGTVVLGEGNGSINVSGAAVVKSGSGTLDLIGSNTYTGATNVTGGTLVLNGVEYVGDKPAKDGEHTAVFNITSGGSQYWLGLEAGPVIPVLRSQLGLPEKQGLVIERVAEGSPAEKAGIKQYDVLTKVDGKPLQDISELIKAVDKAKETKLSLDLIRGGKPQTIAVAPAKRPAGLQIYGLQIGEAIPGQGPEAQALNKMLQGMQNQGGGPMQLHFFHPGMILPPGAPMTPKLPDNTSVAIVKEGDKPAKIVVKQGEQKWEILESELNKLPESLRPAVAQMLGHGPIALPLPGSHVQFGQGNVTFGPAVPVDPRVEQRLNELGRRIERLEKGHERAAPAAAEEKTQDENN
jgi:autotransporter-associated beta strand protein